MIVNLIDFTSNPEIKIAKAAGICYDSSVTDPVKLVKRLKRDGHLATLRFAYATFEISDFSRTCSMQMLRHAFLSYLQRSQRYCKEFNFKYVTPPSIKNNLEAHSLYLETMDLLQNRYKQLVEMGIKKEDARYILPEACHTKMNVTANFQAWYDFLYGNNGRLQKAAQWEIQEIAKEIELVLSKISPNIFGKHND